MKLIYNVTEQDLANSLRRPLTPTEKNNLDSIIAVAISEVEQLLCIELGYYENAERSFHSTEGYRGVKVGVVLSVDEVLVDGKPTDDFELMLGDRGGVGLSHYDTIVFPKPLKGGRKITIRGEFGFKKIPDDLMRLIAEFVAIKPLAGARTVASKKVEDFSISYATKSQVDDISDRYASMIVKYSQCGDGAVRNGKTVELGVRYCGRF